MCCVVSRDGCLMVDFLPPGLWQFFCIGDDFVVNSQLVEVPGAACDFVLFFGAQGGGGAGGGLEEANGVAFAGPGEVVAFGASFVDGAQGGAQGFEV